MSKHVENNVEKLLEEFYKDLKRPLGSIIKQVARAEAVSFARSTQPYTSGDDWDSSRKSGEGAVSRDIRKLYVTKSQVYHDMRQKDEGLADAFWYVLSLGRIGGKRGAQSLLDASNSRFSGLQIAPFNPVIHKENRGAGGRVRGRRPQQIVRNQDHLTKYIEQKKKMVGFVKAGWAACARALGGVRGIPGWVTRQKAPGGITDRTKDETNKYVIIRNNVDYASQALDPRAESRAMKSAHDRLVLMVNMAKEAAAKKKALNVPTA